MDSVFSDLSDHMSEDGMLGSHLIQLIKSVTKNYVKIRMHHLAKESNHAMVKNERVRTIITKWSCLKTSFCFTLKSALFFVINME